MSKTQLIALMTAILFQSEAMPDQDDCMGIAADIYAETEAVFGEDA